MPRRNAQGKHINVTVNTVKITVKKVQIKIQKVKTNLHSDADTTIYVHVSNSDSQRCFWTVQRDYFCVSGLLQQEKGKARESLICRTPIPLSLKSFTLTVCEMQLNDGKKNTSHQASHSAPNFILCSFLDVFQENLK